MKQPKFKLDDIIYFIDDKLNCYGGQIKSIQTINSKEKQKIEYTLRINRDEYFFEENESMILIK